MKTIRCTCCQAELTAPQFHNGKPYGWTCIKKVAPKQKRVKTNYIPTANHKIVSPEGSTRLVVHFTLPKEVEVTQPWKKSHTVVFYSKESMLVQDGVLFINEETLKIQRIVK